MKPVKCLHCESRFADDLGRWQHSKAKHKGLRNPRPVIQVKDDELSMADRLIAAQIAAASGLPVDADIALMFPDEIRQAREGQNVEQ